MPDGADKSKGACVLLECCMTNAEKWGSSLVVDVVVFGSYYLWQVEGIYRAGLVFTFFCWSISIILFIAIPGMNGDVVKKSHRPNGFAWYHFVSEVALLVMLVWANMPILAAFRLIAVLAMECARNQALKELDGEQ